MAKFLSDDEMIQLEQQSQVEPTSKNIITDDEMAKMEADMPSQSEALLRGFAQGATVDWADEIIGGVEVAGSTVFGEDKLADIVENYRKYRDESREATKQAKEAHPGVFTTGQVGGGIATALIPGAAIAKAPTLLGKIATGAKAGGAFGALGGAGASEAEIEQPLDLATDIGTGALTGATVGAVLPLATTTVSRAATGTKDLAGKLAAATPVKLGYKAGKEGIIASKEGITKEGMKFAKAVHSTMYDNLTKNGVAKNEALKLADDIGTKINAGKEIREIYNELVEQGVVSSSAQSEVQPVVKVLKEVIEGVDPAAKNLQKLQKQAEKSIIKKSQESAGREAQAVIKAEKELAKKQEMANLDIKGNVDEIQKVVDDIGTTTGEGGILVGKQATFKPIEGKPFTVKSLSDATPYQPKVELRVSKDGTPIINVQDMGSGKITSFVGDVAEEPLVALRKLDIENLSPTDSEILIKEINRHTDHPVAGAYMKRLAGQLRKLSNEALEEFDTTGANRQIALTTKAAERLGIKDRLAKDGFGANDQTDTVMKKMQSSETVDKTRAFDYMKEAGGDLAKLGERGPFVDDLMKTAGLVDEPLQSTSLVGTLYGSGKALLMKGGNVAGRVNVAVSKKAQPVVETIDNVLTMSKEKLIDIGSKMKLSNNKGVQSFGDKLNTIAEQDGAIKNAMLWSLTQQPAFRHAVKQLDKEALGIGDEPPVDPPINPPSETLVDPPINPPSQPTESVMIPFRPEEEEEEELESFDEVNEVQSSGRSPQSDSVIESVYGKLSFKEGKGDLTRAAVTGNYGVTDNARNAVGLQSEWRNLKTESERDELDKKISKLYLQKLYKQMPQDWKKAPAEVQEAMLDTAYNIPSVLGWPKLGVAMKNEDWEGAARQLLDSASVGGQASRGVAKRRAQSYNTIAKSQGFKQISTINLKDDGTLIYSANDGSEIFTYKPKGGIHDTARPGSIDVDNSSKKQEIQEIINKSTRQLQQLGSGADPMKETASKEALMASIASSNVDPDTKQELEDKAFYGDIKGLQDILNNYKKMMS